MASNSFQIYAKIASWILSGAALLYLLYDLRLQGDALLPVWPAFVILLVPALLATAMASLRSSPRLPRLALAYVLAALLVLPSPGGLLLGALACLAGRGGGIVGPRERSVRVLAIGAITLALAQFLTSLVRGPDASGFQLLVLALLLFGFIQAFSLSLTVLTGELAGEDGMTASHTPWSSLFLESANVPLAWLLADALVRQAWLQSVAFCAVLLAGEAMLCKFSATQDALTRNHSRLSARLSELDTLHSIGREIVSSLDPPKVFSVVERECRKILALDYCFIALAEEDSSRLVAVHRHRRGEPGMSANLVLEEGLAMQVAAEKRARRIDDFDLLPPGSPLRSGLVGTGMRSALAVPLIVEERTVGVLSIQSRHASAYDDHQLNVLTTVAQLAAVAIENARCYQLATVDSLTGFLLRDYFFKRLGEEHQRVSRYGGTFSLLMMDLDGFKRINDRHGHLAGDQYLREVSVAIRGELRSADLTCRYGGDEFCLLLPETELDGARAIAERIRQAVGGRIVSVEGVALRATASIGVTVHPGHEAHDVAGLLRHADEALYLAKRSGRDCVMPYAA